MNEIFLLIAECEKCIQQNQLALELLNTAVRVNNKGKVSEETIKLLVAAAKKIKEDFK